jgi:hypothetical protein
VVLACISIDHGKNEGGVSSVLKSWWYCPGIDR